MKYFAIFSIFIYLGTIFFLREDKKKKVESAFNIDKEIKTSNNSWKKLKSNTDSLKVKSPKETQPKVKKEFFEKVVAAFPKTMETTLTPLEEVSLFKNGKEIKALKILISHQKKDGKKSSYHALVNQETGQVLETFNRPHIESKEKFGLRYKGNI